MEPKKAMRPQWTCLFNFHSESYILLIIFIAGLIYYIAGLIYYIMCIQWMLTIAAGKR